MSALWKRTIQISCVVVAAAVVGIVTSPTLRAQVEGDAIVILGAIKQDTGNILNAVQDLPGKIDALATEVTALITAWNGPYKKDTLGMDASTTLAADFTNLQSTVSSNQALVSSKQSSLITDLETANAITVDKVPYLNDMVFQTLVGLPPVAKDNRGVDASYEYIKNASGLKFTHQVPPYSWMTKSPQTLRYFNFYETINAIQTFDAYVLSQIYADASNGNQLTTQQQALIQLSTGTDGTNGSSGMGWFSKILSENIGLVMRQILMYDSQIYVILTQMMQIQKQQLAAQAMTNTLLILGNSYTENQLYGSASK